MTRLITELGTGYSATAPAESQLIIRKQGYRPTAGAPLILSQHTAGIPSASEPLLSSTSDDFSGIYRDLADAGYMLMCADDAGRNMGNDSGMSRMDDKLTYARASGAWNGPFIYFGMSMGGLLSFNKTRQLIANTQPTPAGIVAMVPVCDLNNVWQNPTFTAQVNTAYGGSYNDATMGPTHNPAQFGAQLAGIPILILADQDDTTTIVYSTVTSLVGLIGSSCTLISGHWGGSHGSAQEFAALRSYMPTILQFMDSLK